MGGGLNMKYYPTDKQISLCYVLCKYFGIDFDTIEEKDVVKFIYEYKELMDADIYLRECELMDKLNREMIE